MFFQDQIKNIKPNDRVLEIGPGSTPHPRSNEFLELRYTDISSEQAQFGHTGKLITDKEIHFYDGSVFPFKDDSFDYIICSHVLEHVHDIPKFMSELKRVAPKGYLEYPNIYYDYLFNFHVHLNFIKKEGNELLWMKKKDTALHKFEKLHIDFYKLLDKGHQSIFIQENRVFFFEGFEWDRTIKQKEVEDLNLLAHSNFKPAEFNIEKYLKNNVSAKTLIKIIFQKVFKKGQ